MDKKLVECSQDTMRRLDYQIITDLIEPQSRVLDLGCGSGCLLARLRQEKKVTGYGVELSPNHITECIGRGLSVFHGDIDEGLRDFEDNSFDYVVVNQTLPVTHHPTLVFEEMLRVGKYAIVSFANFGYWRVRMGLLLKGCMPVTNSIPYEWYDTPNIHLFTIRDFQKFYEKMGVKVVNTRYFNDLYAPSAKNNLLFANWRAPYAMFVLTR